MNSTITSKYTEVISEVTKVNVGLCVDDGWFNQSHLAQSDLNLGLDEAAHLLHIE